MNGSLVSRLKKALDRVAPLYESLIFLVGATGDENSEVVTDCVKELDIPLLNVNSELSRELLQVPEKRRPMEAQNSLIGMAAHCSANALFVTDIQLLFAPALKLDPVKLFRNLSKHKPLIINWPGDLQDNQLVYAEPDHPEYTAASVEDCVIIELD